MSCLYTNTATRPTPDPPTTDPNINETNNGDGDGDSGLSDGAIAGISIGVIVFVVVVVGSSGAVYCCVCWKKDGKISCLGKEYNNYICCTHAYKLCMRILICTCMLIKNT